MTLSVAMGSAPALLFEHPEHVWAPPDLNGGVAALHAAEAALRDGYWIAGGLTYEFGAQLHGVATRPSNGEPLLVLGAFRAPVRRAFPSNQDFRMSAPLARVPPDAYAGAIASIVNAIREGEVYQVNYTVPFDLGFSGDPAALYGFLCERARVPHSALLRYGGTAVVSISPELFLRFDGERVTAKPMKGTAALDRIAELTNEKNRAEHVMIVDLLRNDLHRFCERVEVDPLCEIERYPTFATMTSQIHGYRRGGVPFAQAMLAAFPCGSVTGAPKRAAIAHIARLEQSARGYYTGTIGYRSPEGTGEWNVPIRTIQLGHAARYDCGGGIVADSAAQSEWDEVLLKSRFLAGASADFSLWETLRCGPGASDVDAHLARLAKSARAFAFALDLDALRTELLAGNGSAALTRVRAYDGRYEILREPLPEQTQPVEVCYAQERVRADDPLLRHKTAWRPVHERAAALARELGCFDALLENERGEITEGARTNVFALIGGVLCTPPLASGVLPGILRTRLVTQGDAVERVLVRADLASAQAVYVGNSARGLLPVRIR